MRDIGGPGKRRKARPAANFHPAGPFALSIYPSRGKICSSTALRHLLIHFRPEGGLAETRSAVDKC
jgi:hypothetical protein